MSFYSKFVYPYLQRMDAEVAHDRAIQVLEHAQAWAVGRAMLRGLAGEVPSRPVRAFGVEFPNVLGVAAGFDKDVRVSRGLACLGFGHVEVGTLTPRPQAGNPKPRVFRLAEDHALINRMGFPNGGVDAALPRLIRLWELKGRRFRIGVSLGKQKETPLEDAARDYVAVMQRVLPYADYLAVNISSPNTPGLRELQGVDYLGSLLGELRAENTRLSAAQHIEPRPLLVKVAPDLTPDELDTIVDVALEQGMAGIIATNTTRSREGLSSPLREQEGGMSGAPLKARSTDIVTRIARRAGGKLTIVAVGGVYSAAGLREKMDAGAKLVQMYTGLVYEGPGVAGRVLRDLMNGL
jgi:dihydroorotate dehydrogenase